MKEPIRRISNKLTKTRVLLRKQELRKYIPITKKMNKNVLYEMLQKHKMVYIKPCCGSLGQGVIRIERSQDHSSKNDQPTAISPVRINIHFLITRWLIGQSLARPKESPIWCKKGFGFWFMREGHLISGLWCKEILRVGGKLQALRVA